MDHCCLEYSNDSNIRIKVSESLDSDSDSVQLQMSNKIRIRIRKKFFDEYYSDSDSPEKKDSFQHWCQHDQTTAGPHYYGEYCSDSDSPEKKIRCNTGVDTVHML